MWTKMYFIIKSGNIGRILFLPSLLSGPSRLSQVIGLSVGMCSVCLLHSGRQLRARLHCSGGTKQAQARRRRRRGGRGGAEEQCAKREKEKLCITFSCCSFSSGWPRSGLRTAEVLKSVFLTSCSFRGRSAEPRGQTPTGDARECLEPEGGPLRRRSRGKRRENGAF